MTPPAGSEEVREPDFERAYNWALQVATVGLEHHETNPIVNLGRAYVALQARVEEAEGLIDEYGIDTVGTGSGPSKKEQARVDKIVHAIAERGRLAKLEQESGRGEG